MSRNIDYATIAVPDDKAPPEYTYAERRAEILELVRRAGHPGVLNKSELARRYDCSDANIHNDLDVLADYAVNAIDETRFDATAKFVFDKAVREFIDRGEYMKAVSVIESQDAWLARRGHVEEQPDRHEVAVDANLALSSEEKAQLDAMFDEPDDLEEGTS